MKHISLVFSAVLSLAALSCTVMEAPALEEEYVEVYFTAANGATKTTLDGGNVLWQAGDAVKVHYSNSGNDYKFTVVGNPTGDEAVFQGTIKSSDQANAIEGVMYPYTDIASFWWIYWSHVQVPTDQPFFDGGFASGVNPSLGRVSKGEATFYNVCGLVSVQVSGDVKISKVRLSGNNGEAVAGMYKYNVSSGISLDLVESVSSSVSVSVTDGPVSVSEAKTFVFVVAPVNLTGGLTLTFTNEKGEVCTRTIDNALNVQRAKKAVLAPVELSASDFAMPVPQSGNLIVNGTFDTEVESTKYSYPVDRVWRYSEGWSGGSGTTVYWDPAAGVGGSPCVVVSSPSVTCSTGFSQVVSGLVVDAPYVLTAKVRTENVSKDAGNGYTTSGANLAVVIDDATWPAKSEPLYGTNDWTAIRLEFEPVTESVIVRLFLGGTASAASGKAWFDDVELTYNEGMYICRSEHVRVLVEQDYFDKSSITQEQVEAWLSNLDRIYEQYKAFFKGRVPYDGKFITLRSATINAWAYAGNPVQWNRNYITSSFNAIARGDWSFGLMHELGHDFSPSISDATYAWNFNEELFANFRMFYAIDHIGSDATVINNAGSWNEKIYHGREITGLYYSDTDNCYLNTIAKGRAVEMGNALTWCFVRMVDEFGWELWEDTFDELYQIPSDAIDTTDWTQWDKFQCLLSYLNRHVPEGRDVRETFPEGDLEIIEAYLKTQN